MAPTIQTETEGERPDKRLPTTDELTGSDPGFTGGLSTEEHLRRIRGGEPERAGITADELESMDERLGILERAVRGLDGLFRPAYAEAVMGEKSYPETKWDAHVDGPALVRLFLALEGLGIAFPELEVPERKNAVGWRGWREMVERERARMTSTPA